MGRPQLSFKPWLYLYFSTPLVCVWADTHLLCNRVAGNLSRPWRCAASGSCALWRWPRPFALQAGSSSCGWGPPFVPADSGWVCFPLSLSLRLPLPQFQHWLRNRGSEVIRGWTTERGFIWEAVTFLCAPGQNTPPHFFNTPPMTIPLLQPSASCSFPIGDPSPRSVWPRAVAVTLALAVK